MKKIAASLMLVVPVFAFSATYREANNSNQMPGIAMISLGVTGCVYANVPVALGDIVSHADGSQQVCASGKRGPVFMDLTAGNR